MITSDDSSESVYSSFREGYFILNNIPCPCRGDITAINVVINFGSRIKKNLIFCYLDFS